jgi:hypothetical protein
LLNNALTYVTKRYSLGSGISRLSEAKHRKIFKADEKQQDSDEFMLVGQLFSAHLLDKIIRPS